MDVNDAATCDSLSIGSFSTLTDDGTRSIDSKTPSEYDEYRGTGERAKVSSDRLQLKWAIRRMRGEEGELRALVEVKCTLDGNGENICAFKILNCPHWYYVDEEVCRVVEVVETHHRDGEEIGQKHYVKEAPSSFEF